MVSRRNEQRSTVPQTERGKNPASMTNPAAELGAEHPAVQELKARASRDRVRRGVEESLDAYLKVVPENDPGAINIRKAIENSAWFTRQETGKRKDISAGAANGTHIFFSAGESFADGAMIELISGSSKPNLLLWDGLKANVGSRVEHGSCTYEALELDPILWRAIRLPSRCCDYGSARALFDGIRNLFQRHLGLPKSESGLIACFAISSWLADRLPSAPGLTISSADEELGIDVLRLLSCVCRHPLMLAELTPSGFRSLPMQVSLTLLLDQQRIKQNVLRLLRASSHRGMHLPGNRGCIVDLYGPKAIFCGNDAAVDSLSRGMIQISVAPSQLSSTVDAEVQDEIANRFQPLLLMYRLKNSGKLRDSRVDVSSFTFATRQLARTLAMCFPDDSKLSRDTIELLRKQDEEVRERRFFDVNYAIVEILLGMIHHRKQREVRVNELAKGVNALLRSRGEIVEHSAEEVGWKLRNLNIYRRGDSSGRQILLGRDTSQKVHRLAKDYDLPSSQRVEAGCLDCAQAERTLHN